MFVAAAIGLIGVIFVARADAGIFNQMGVIGLNASFLAAMVFVTVRVLTSTKSPEKIGFNFCFIGTLISTVLALGALFMG